MITIEDNEKILQDILEGANLNDVAKVTENLQKLRDNFSKDFTDFSTISNRNEELNLSNEKLRQCNMDLFLKIPNTNSDEIEKIEKETKDNIDESENLIKNVINDIGGFTDGN